MELPIFLRRILYSRLMLIFSIFIFIVVFFQLTQVVSRGSDTDKEIKGLEKQVNDLSLEQKRLEKIKSFLKTDFFAEREARTRFGLQKNGEHAVIITGRDQGLMQTTDGNGRLVDTKKASTPGGEVSPIQNDESNNHRWFRYFFGTH